MNKSYSISGLTASLRAVLQRSVLTVLTVIALCAISCSPEAKWETSNVDITISPKIVSAGFIRCDFTVSKDAYYLIASEPVKPGEHPMDHQKAFMTLALDSAYVEYLSWRHELLEKKEFYIAPFASHSLQYGNVHHMFTLLRPDTDYWIYAFVVNPTTMKPAGKLFLSQVHTAPKSTVDITFEYRIKGFWDYIYPTDTLGAIVEHYPYVAATCDSDEVADLYDQTPEQYLRELFGTMTRNNDILRNNVRYGVNATDNSFLGSGHIFFETGKTYYIGIAGCDGSLEKLYIYRFVWTGEEFEAYFTDEDNIVSKRKND